MRHTGRRVEIAKQAAAITFPPGRFMAANLKGTEMPEYLKKLITRLTPAQIESLKALDGHALCWLMDDDELWLIQELRIRFPGSVVMAGAEPMNMPNR